MFKNNIAPPSLTMITLFKLSVVQILPILVLHSYILRASSTSDQCFKYIISFGDSITDTGNAAYLSRNDKVPASYTLPPYGETFFHHPTGRCSDGRLIIDFLAEELKIPFVKPFHGSVDKSPSVNNENGFNESVNFAVVGVTALDDSALRSSGVKLIGPANESLSYQLTWFKHFLSKNCLTSSGCRESFQSTLVLVGEVGGNDYNLAFLQGKTEEQALQLVPNVINKISTIINELINLGAVTLIVPGNFPIGCIPFYFWLYGNNNKQNYYDSKTGCITWLNQFAQYHNKMLQMELNRIQMLHPRTTIIYADYYNAAMNIYLSPEKYGFTGGVLKSCYGSGDGNLPSQGCVDPSLYVNWDGIHFTEAAYKLMAKYLYGGSNATIRLNSICARISNDGFYESGIENKATL